MSAFVARLFSTTDSTRGILFLDARPFCDLLEPGPPREVNNYPHCRVPAAVYQMFLRTDGHNYATYKPTYEAVYGVGSFAGIIELRDVPHRTAIQIHPFNYPYARGGKPAESDGCLGPNYGVGKERGDMGRSHWRGFDSRGAWLALHHELQKRIIAGDDMVEIAEAEGA